ncbi:hypothetical protein GCM10017786_21340 [Amycolatopsis deserti]|uniref:Uncharacterized protein n=1 Tax=Amycolatopsis deserti TaxID=185696 RepID=A0ABQ3INR8_9PSEU|nr:hypothetical protein [Amycolatopsis deserti]GHE89037.1 hypothetical protein GCM10017786_21340 [Amycolatopsis deserti]
MLEFFKAILDAVLAITPKALTARKDAKRNALGAELFGLYLRAHRILDTGEHLVGLLSEAATMSDQERDHPRTQSWWIDHLYATLAEQSGNFSLLNAELTRLGGCLAALDPDAYGRLKRVLWRKSSRINDLRSALARRMLPEAPALGLYPGHDPVTTFVGLMEPVRPRTEPEGLDLRRPLTPEARENISRYLAVHRPQEQLAEIRTQLKTLHQALVATFSLDDILLGLSAGAGRADPGGLLPR